MSELLSLTDSNFKEQVLNSSGVWLVDFWAPWCGPCKTIEPIIEAINNEKALLKVGKVNVDESPLLSSKFGILSIPTMLVFKGGELVDTIRGAQSKETIEAHIEEALRIEDPI